MEVDPSSNNDNGKVQGPLAGTECEYLVPKKFGKYRYTQIQGLKMQNPKFGKSLVSDFSVF